MSSATRVTPSGANSFFEKTQNKSSQPSSVSHYIPPWTKPYIIGVAGTSGSGKTSVASRIIEELNTPWTVLLSIDNFYRPLNSEQRTQAFNNEYDFDSPAAVDLDYCYECVKSLKEGNKTKIPVYSFAEHNRVPSKEITVYGANVIIVEGIYALYHEKLRGLMNLKIYVDTDLDICLARRLSRDILYRGRELTGALKQWTLFVKPNADRFIRPTMQYADLVLPRGANNYIAIDMMIQHIQKQLARKSREHLEYLEGLNEHGSKYNLLSLENVVVLKSTNQMNAMHTTLLDKTTQRDDFIFYFNRVATILINKALEYASYSPTGVIETEVGKFDGIKLSDEVMAVNIIRSGDCFMHSLMQTSPEIKIGKLLIQSDRNTGEPQLHSIMLPQIENHKVLLMDAQIITGAAVIMSIQILIDHGVKMENIIVVCYLSTQQGLQRILAAFPQVTIVVARVGAREKNGGSSLDTESESDWWFRTRFIDTLYYGT